jgi:hypothetical protein
MRSRDKKERVRGGQGDNVSVRSARVVASTAPAAGQATDARQVEDAAVGADDIVGDDLAILPRNALDEGNDRVATLQPADTRIGSTSGEQDSIGPSGERAPAEPRRRWHS